MIDKVVLMLHRDQSGSCEISPALVCLTERVITENVMAKMPHHWEHCWHIVAETNGRHFPDDIFQCIFLNENVSISIKISLKFVPKGQINSIPPLV